MDQSLVHHAAYLPVIHGPKAAKPAKSAMLAQPGARNFRFSRATAALAQAGQRLAVIARRVGQPADTFSGPEAPAPEDIRTRYVSGVFGTHEMPRSLRDSSRRW